MQKNAIFSKTKQFRAMVSIDDLYEVMYNVSLTGLFKEPIIGSLQSKMAEIRHLENRHDVIIATLQGVRIPSAILKIVFRHISFFLFLMQFRL